MQGMSPEEYEAQKERVADEICKRLEALWPGLRAAIEFREVRCSMDLGLIRLNAPTAL